MRTINDVRKHFEEVMADLGRKHCLVRDSNGAYSYVWMRDQWEGWLLCAVNTGIIASSEVA
jgi:hypothetical protein